MSTEERKLAQAIVDSILKYDQADEDKFLVDTMIHGTAFLKGEFINGQIVITPVSFDEVFNPALEGGLILGGIMTKEEVLKKYHDAMDIAQDEALGLVFEDAKSIGFEEGKSVTGEFTQADLDAKFAEGKVAGAEEYKANDPTPVSLEEKAALEAKLDAAVAAGELNAELVAKAKALFGIVAPAPVVEPVPAPIDEGNTGTIAEA